MIFARDLAFPEGPVVLPDGSLLVVEIAGAPGCITHVSADGKSKRRIAETGRPNGLAVDRHGDIWVAESRQRALLRVTFAGKVETVQTHCGDLPFLFPNDLCFGPDGALYLTDSGIPIDDFAPGNQVRPDWETVYPDGRVYRIDPADGHTTLVDRGIRFTNGIAFAPDSSLFVNETLTGNVYRYPTDGTVGLGERTLHGNVIDPDASAGMKGPDGMAFDRAGTLAVATFGQGQVVFLDTSGQVQRRFATEGRHPTNVAFGLPGSGLMYITESERGQIEVIEDAGEGLALWN